MERLSTAARAVTHARVGLIGNPSDGYGGAAIAFSFDAFAAEVSLSRDTAAQCGFAIDWQGERILAADSLEDALAEPAARAEHGAARLVLAAGRILLRTAAAPVLGLAADKAPEHGALVIAGHSSIPMRAGLAGSSAIVISALRVLARHLGVALSRDELASLALRAETEELGIAAGPMDRIAQVRGGLLFMDFAGNEAAVAPVAASVPEELYVAWDRHVGEPSGRVHGALRERFEVGEPRVLAAMERFRALAYRGREALEAGDASALGRLFDENFDLRRDVVGVGERDEALVTLGRRHGAGVKLTGSGGAVVGLAPRDAQPELRRAYTEAGHGWLQPRLAGPTERDRDEGVSA